jgi:hypothetical protein
MGKTRLVAEFASLGLLVRRLRRAIAEHRFSGTWTPS